MWAIIRSDTRANILGGIGWSIGVMRKTRKRNHPLLRRILWVSAPLAISAPLILGANSLFGADLVYAAARLSDLSQFQFEQQAAQHCPDDSIVWGVTHVGIYNSNTERWYGQTSDCAFICLQDAQKAGYRASHLAQ
jgi:hypothetical protein